MEDTKTSLVARSQRVKNYKITIFSNHHVRVKRLTLFLMDGGIERLKYFSQSFGTHLAAQFARATQLCLNQPEMGDCTG